MAIDTAKYTAMVDASTPSTLRNTLSAAGDTATRDAQKLDDEANDLKKSAANFEGMPGMAAAAEDMAREAAARASTADGRRGIAAGLHSQASAVVG